MGIQDNLTFHDLLETWDAFLLEQENKQILDSMIEQLGLLFFFKKDEEYFGGGENARIVFAKIKDKNDDSPDDWKKEATVTVENLSKLAAGNPAKQIFTYKDLKDVVVVDKEEAIDNIHVPKTSSGLKIIKFQITRPSEDTK